MVLQCPVPFSGGLGQGGTKERALILSQPLLMCLALLCQSEGNMWCPQTRVMVILKLMKLVLACTRRSGATSTLFPLCPVVWCQGPVQRPLFGLNPSEAVSLMSHAGLCILSLEDRRSSSHSSSRPPLVQPHSLFTSLRSADYVGCLCCRSPGGHGFCEALLHCVSLPFPGEPTESPERGTNPAIAFL